MKFEPEDFGYVDGNHDHDSIECVDAAKIANAKLEAWLKKAPTVYSMKKEGMFSGLQLWGKAKGPRDTHQAKLVQIEEV